MLEAFDKLVARKAASETMLFWRMLNVELWLRAFVDNDPTEMLVGERVVPVAQDGEVSP